MMWFWGKSPEDSGTATERILRVFAKNGGKATVPQLLKVCPASYRQRINDLRKSGKRIDCMTITERKKGKYVTIKTVYFLDHE